MGSVFWKWVSVRKYSMCDRGRIILYKYFLATTSLCSGGSTSENVPQKAIEEKKGIRYWLVETNVWIWRTDHISCSVKLSCNITKVPWSVQFLELTVSPGFHNVNLLIWCSKHLCIVSCEPALGERVTCTIYHAPRGKNCSLSENSIITRRMCQKSYIISARR